MQWDDSDIRYNVPMSTLTSMRVGGPASLFCEPASEEELIDRVLGCESAGESYFLLGNGTNVIVRDKGYSGVVISTLKALLGIEVKSGLSSQGSNPSFSGSDPPRSGGDLSSSGIVSSSSGSDLSNPETVIVCGAGESLTGVCRFAAKHGLSGMEALSGIPGTVGGAVFMNAGAYDREIADLIISVRAFDVVDKKIIMLTNKDLEFSYRSSIFKSNTFNSNNFNARPMIILSAELSLAPGDQEEIKAKMADFNKKRNEKQPVDLPSAGSFFKRPEGYFAGKLIEESGMKGACAGGARVSEKHAGFILNTGNATAEDVLELAEKVKSKVYEKFGVKLEEEPIVIGDN